MSWVEVHNERTNELLLGNVRHCSGFLSRLRGLMFRRVLRDDEGLLLIGKREDRLDAAIHMFFVFFPIAVIWLDSGGCVVDAQLARPFRPFYAPDAAAKDVLEGPPALLDRVQVGDPLRFEKAAHE